MKNSVSGTAKEDPFPNKPLTLAIVQATFRRAGCHSLYVKALAWNHDSKRQIYIASSDLSAFNIFPVRIEYAPPMPKGMEETRKPRKADAARIYGHLTFEWLRIDDDTERAPSATHIYCHLQLRA